MEYDEMFEITEKDIMYRKVIFSFKCPICGEQAYLKETDVFMTIPYSIYQTIP